MSRVLQVQAAKISATAGNAEANCTTAPSGTTQVVISSPVACRVHVGSDYAYCFNTKVYGVLASNPTNGKTFSVNGTTFTFVTSGSGATQIVIGADLNATLNNLATKVAAQLGAGWQVANLNASVAGLFEVWRTSVVGIGPAGDLATYISNPTGGPMAVPASGATRYGTGGSGTYVPANVPVTLDAEEGVGVATLSLGTGSDPASGAGATVTYMGAG